MFTAPPADDINLNSFYNKIRALDDAAGFELDASRTISECAEGEPDREAAAAAERAAHIHQTRIGLVRELAADPAVQAHGPEELIPLAYQATSAFARQFACDPSNSAPLDAARALLIKLRADMPAGSSGADSLDRKLAELDAQLAAFHDAHPAGPADRPSVQLVVQGGEVTPAARSSFSSSGGVLDRLALRLEFGANFVRAGEPATAFHHRGAAGRLAVLARYHASERARVHLLFGPYYGFSSVSDPRRADGIEWYQGSMLLHRFGGQFEVQWVPAARLQRWLSLNPALEVGLEANHHDRETGYATGFQFGGGLSLCIWHQSICPGARALVSPLAHSPHAVVAVQAGVALDLLRFVAIGHTAHQNRAAREPRPRR